ncbi:MAG: Gfo/Idh/MocA family oxidoreductase [Chloroflexi bacterium]|nr:Gfo/Idh/MocA family oxidoreductase [Chloroflexota bacterium]
MAIGWAIIGIGRHPDRKMAPAITKARDSRLVAVFSRDIGRARAFAERHGALGAYDTIPALLRHPGVDCVYIASPNALHREHTLLALAAGKHVLVEKPMALTPADCEAMVEAANKRGLKLGVGFHLRHHPGHREVRDLVQRGTLGKVWLVQGSWASGARGEMEPPPRTGLLAWWMDHSLVGGGTMMGTGVHLIDLIRFVTGQEVREVQALSDGGTPEHPLEWLVTAQFRLTDGAFAIMYVSRRIPDPHNDLLVYGSLGRTHTEGTLSTDIGGHLKVVSNQINTTAEYAEGDMYLNQVEAFHRAVLQGKEPDASGVDGLRVCQVTEAVFRAAREGKRVVLSY